MLHRRCRLWMDCLINCVIIIPAKLCNQRKKLSHDVELNNKGILHFTFTLLLRALSTALLAAFFFWIYRCLKTVGGCSPLSLMPSIAFHASRFSPTALATSSVHHPWFLLLVVTPFPDILPHSSSATPNECTLVLPPFNLLFLFPSPRLAHHTSSLPSPYTLPSSHPCTSTT